MRVTAAAVVAALLLLVNLRSTRIVSHPLPVQIQALQTHREDGQRDKPIPRIVHQIHKNLEALDSHQSQLRAVCMQLHPQWRFMFWSDDDLDAFVARQYSWYYLTWQSLEPRIKQIDTARYMLMHHFGGIYIDVDVECVTAFDSFVRPLAPGTAWLGGFPEPMFLMSAPGNKFWLHVLDRIRRVWAITDAWHSTGPLGLNGAATEWVEGHGSGVLVPFVTHRTEPEFHSFAKNPNNSVSWFMLTAKPAEASIQYFWNDPGNHTRHGTLLGRMEPNAANTRIGFIPNDLLDHAACNANTLAHCSLSFCGPTWPYAYIVHHCQNTWRGRIGIS